MRGCFVCGWRMGGCVCGHGKGERVVLNEE